MTNNRFKGQGIMEKGYGFIAKKVMKDKDLSIEAKAIYAYLSSYTGAGDTAYPSVSLMCGDLKISEARFYSHRKQLEEKGYIVINKHRNEKGWLNNVYTLPFIPTPQNLSTQNLSTQNLSTQNLSTQNVGTISNSSKSNSIKSNSNKKTSSAELTERFEKLWKLYPRKQGKKDALRHYKRAIKEGATDLEIEQGIEAYIREIKITNTKKQFIKHGSAWFNQRGWQDEYLGEDEKKNNNKNNKVGEVFDDLF